MSTTAISAIFAGTITVSLSLGASAASGGSPTPERSETRYLPIQSISYDFGSKAARGYYVKENDECLVVLMIADKIDPDQSTLVLPTRIRLALRPGQTASLDSEGGPPLTFSCAEAAAALLVTPGNSENLASLSLMGAVVAGPIEDTEAGLERGNYSTAPWLLNALAQFNLGVMYEMGQGASRDYAEAAKWYRRAADQGLPQAEQHLGNLLLYGWGVPKDYTEAVQWYRKAAAQGSGLAQFDLGFLTLTGHGMPQDLVQAHMWFNSAAEQLVPNAAAMRDYVARRMTPVQIEEERELAKAKLN
jgi:TPR repeat protein